MKKAERLEVLMDAAEKWEEQLEYMLNRDCTKGEKKSYRKQLKKIKAALKQESARLYRRGKEDEFAGKVEIVPGSQHAIKGVRTMYWQNGDLAEFKRMDGTYLWGVVVAVNDLPGGAELIVKQPGSPTKFVWSAARCRLLRRNGVAIRYTALHNN